MNSNEVEANIQPFYAKWANVPFSPSRFPFFYGWVIVFISTVCIVCSVPGQTAGIGPFTDYLMEALGLSREKLSLAYMIGTITSGLLLPYAGKVLDKVGVRVMSVLASTGLAVSLLMFANAGKINDLLDGYGGVYLTVGVASLAFLLVRFFGQGNMTMVGRVAIGRWFNHWRGTATAIAGVPIAFAFNSAPWLMNKLINAFGWKGACLLLACCIGGGMTIIGALLFRDTPEECGLRMDGLTEDQSKKKEDKQLHVVHKEFTRGEAVRTISFWAFVFGLAVHSLIVTAIAFNITSIGEEMGKTKDEALLMFVYSSFISIPSRFIVSYLVDNTRLKLKAVLMMMAVTIFSYSLGLAWFDTGLGRVVTIVGLGLSGGVWGVVCNVTFPRYFGRKHLGAISGLNMSVIVIASAIGPALFNYCKVWLGSYQKASLSVLVLPAAMLVLAMLAGNPQENNNDQ